MQYINIEKINFKLKCKDIIFFGTGRISSQFYEKYCKEKNIIPKPVYFCDNNKEKQGSTFCNRTIISVNKLFELIGENKDKYVVVICMMGTNALSVIGQLESLSGGNIGIPMYLSTQIEALNYFTENSEKIDMILKSFADEKSKGIYKKMIDNICNGQLTDFSIVEEHQYINNDVIDKITDDEVIVDAGVCKGEEIDEMLFLNDKCQIYAFEPDNKSYTQLMEKYVNQGNVKILKYALWHKTEKLEFVANNISPESSRMKIANDKSFNTIETIRLDDIEIKEQISLIKMDIEGAEYKALLGAQKTLCKYKPKLAICVYHNVEDYVKIPFYIISQYKNIGHKFYFRQHSVMNGESVFYAI